MIVSTKGKRAAEAVRDRYGKGFPTDLVKRTRAMLSAMNAAMVLEDLRFPPGNHLGRRLNAPQPEIVDYPPATRAGIALGIVEGVAVAQALMHLPGTAAKPRLEAA